MPERVSRQRRETALEVARKVLDPEYRRKHGLGSEREIPVMIALWSDPLERIVEQVASQGGRAMVAVRRPDGALVSLDLEWASLPDAARRPEPDEPLTAAPGATVGMLVDTVGREGDFSFVLENSPLGQFNLAVAGAQ